MAILIVPVIGALVGNALILTPILGMSGMAIGWMAGSIIANAFTPGQRTYGSKLGDLSVVSSAYGTVIPYTQGSPRLAGQIIWASTKREIATTTKSGGKGGRKSKHTSYSYVVDLLILLTDNEIPGISRVWNNGKLVWDRSTTADINTRLASNATSLWSRMTVYTGSASQNPDPTYEAAVTTNSAPAYRGRGTVFIQDLDLGSYGQIPNLTFEIGEEGPPVRTPWESDNNTLLLLHVDGTDGSTVYTDSSPNNSVITLFGTTALDTDVTAEVGTASSWHNGPVDGSYFTALIGAPASALGDFCIEFWARAISNTCWFYLSGGGYLYNDSFQSYGGTALSLETTPSTLAWRHYRINREGSLITSWLDGVLVSSQTYAGSIDASTIYFGKFVPNNNLHFGGHIDEIRVSNISRGNSNFSPNPYA